MVNPQRFDVPIVQRAMVFKFQRADRMRDAFEGVALAVGEIVGRINAPGVTRAMMMGMADPIHGRIAEVHVG